MRSTRLALAFPFASILALAACTQSTTADGGMGDAGGGGGDTGAHPTDGGGGTGDTGGRDVGLDSGRAPICAGMGCNIVAIDALSASTCVLRANGQVDCWGRGQDGELGDGAMRHSDDCRLTNENLTDCSRDAVTVALPGPADSIWSLGSIQMCATLRTSHQIWCWGGLAFQVGMTLPHDRYAPEHFLVDGVASADGTAGVAVSFGNICWINADTTVSCIGGGSSGRLGTGNFNNTDTPVTMLLPDGSGPLTGVLEVEANGGTACVRTAAHVYCVGNNQYGQLGSAPPHSSCFSPPSTHYDCNNLPLEVTGLDATHVIDMQLDGDYTCALLDTGHMDCWGLGASGGLGTGNITSTHVPTEPTGLTNVAEMRLANGATCALLHDGTVWCTGRADYGQVGDGRMAHDSTPCIDEDGSLFDCQLTMVQVSGITDGVHLAAGSQHLCVLRQSGAISCWGASIRYQLGDEMRPNPAFSPVTVVALGP